MTKNDVTWQLVPPKTHRCNAAEQAIQTNKNHLNAGIALLDPSFPVREWDRLLEVIRKCKQVRFLLTDCEVICVSRNPDLRTLPD